MPAGLSCGADCKPEILAKSYLGQAFAITAEQILNLFDALPQSASNCSAQGSSFGAGAFVRVGVGLRQSCKQYPNSVRAINKFAQGVVDALTYTSFVILDNNQATAHRDSQNARLPNVVIPLSSFRGGEIVVRTGQQDVVLDVSQGPVSFCAREHDHWTRPFRGRRVVLVLFSLQGFSHLSDEDARCLAQLGFPAPTQEALASKQVSEPMSLPARASSQPARDVCYPGNVLLSDVQQAASLGCNSLAPQGPNEDPMPRSKVPRLAPRLDRQAPLLLEICAGSAALSSAASQRGWDVVPVDQASCRFTPHTPLVILDLRDPSSLDVLLGFDRASPADWIHLELPCRTCSRARERPLPGTHGAQPLRGPDALFGLPGLRPFEAEQVAAANAVYRACIRPLFRAYQTGALISIENPVRSWLWPLLASLVKTFGHAGFAEWYFALTD